MLLQYGDSGLVCVGGIIVAAHTFLEGQRLVEAAQHVGVIFLAVIVEDEASLPQRGGCLNSLEFVGLFAFVANNGQLVAAQFALLFEIVH